MGLGQEIDASRRSGKVLSSSQEVVIQDRVLTIQDWLLMIRELGSFQIQVRVIVSIIQQVRLNCKRLVYRVIEYRDTITLYSQI